MAVNATAGTQEPVGSGEDGPDASGDRRVRVASAHQLLTQATLLDATDHCNALVSSREWLLHPSELPLALVGNAFSVECPISGKGRVFIKRAPLPGARGMGADQVDLTATLVPDGGFEYVLHQTGPTDLEDWADVAYENGAFGRTVALQRWQRGLRPPTPGHVTPRFLSNSWGDENRDSRIRHDFILQEIDAAARLGVEVVQLDDGWQRGRSANSVEAEAKGGVWSGFWDADPDFWSPDPDRFPEGLDVITAYGRSKGVDIGLWYAPDSHAEFANWQRDAEQILRIHHGLKIKHFKLDSISAASETSRRNLRAMLRRIAEGSHGQIVADLDITAGVRPGYFGEIGVGPLFLENRYTDWRNYWPHQTLRNLWQLTHWIDPRRLRIELLNNARNTHQYESDPLGPAEYPPATLFAITMFANPLGWFENSGLSDAFVESVAPLVEVWKAHRSGIFAGDIIPVGAAPDGVAWTGFLSRDEPSKSAYVLVFNELSPRSEYAITLPHRYSEVEVLAGDGAASINDESLRLSMDRPLGFVFARVSC